MNSCGSKLYQFVLFFVLFTTGMFWSCPLPAAVDRAENLIPNAGFEDDGAWARVGGGFRLDDSTAHSGKRSLMLSGQSSEETHGASLTIQLDPPIHHPFLISGWSKAENAEVSQDYNLYLDVHYADGTPLWGQKAEFIPGTHDWQKSEFQFNVEKPVKSMEIYVLFRKAQGTVWFDDLALRLAPFVFRDVRVLPGLFGGGLGVTCATTLPASWRVTVETLSGVAAEKNGEHAPVMFLCNAPLPPDYVVQITTTDDLLKERIHERREVHQPVLEKTRGYAAWTESSMRRIMPTSLPPACQAPLRADIDLAGNEFESFQEALLPGPGTTLKNVTVEIDDLVCSQSGARISKDNVQWFQVGYVKLDQVVPHPADPGASPGWWPDALLPVPKFSVEAGFSQALWFTVYAPPHVPSGDYTGTIRIRPENADAIETEVHAHVYGFALPARNHLKTAFALMDGFLEQVYGKPLTPGLRQAYGDYLLDHRLNPDDISRTAPPVIDDLLHYGDRLNAFNVLNMVEERGNHPWVCYSEAAVYTPAFKEQIKQRLDPCADLLRKSNLFERAYIYTFDERGKEFYPIIRDFFGMVKERYPEVHTLTTAYLRQDPTLLKELNADWICPLTSVYRYEDAERCRAAGHQVWSYVCMGPRHPYANWLCDHPLIEARVIWWQAYREKMDGFLYWGLNIWDLPHNDKPVDPENGPLLDWSITTGGAYNWLHGDGRLLYAGKSGPIGSIRLENIRDGLEDYEYLCKLAEAAGEVETARAACIPVTQTLTHFTRDPAELLRQRKGIAEQIAVKK